MEIPRFRSIIRILEKKTVFIECDRDMLPMDTMVQEVALKTKKDIDDFCSKMYAERLGDQLPLWRGFVGNNMEDGRSCFVFCVDHCIGDGVSLVATLMAILDDRDKAADGPLAKEVAAPRKREAKQPGCGEKICAAVSGCCDAIIGDQLPGDPPNQLKLKNHRRPGHVKSMAQSEHISLDKIKEVAKKWENCTVNDILMTVLTMTLQAYFEKCEPATLDKKFRALFVISLRPTGADMLSPEFYGNIFSNGKMRFPMHLKHPREIFRNVKQQIDYVKVSPAPIITSRISTCMANTTCISTQQKMDMVLDLYGKCSACLSNVMGPQEEVNFCGQALDDLQFYAFAPQGVYFGILSYNGKVSVGILSDVECEPDASKLAVEWTSAFDRLYAAALA